MYKKLHLRLTLFCTFICGLILVVLSLFCLSFSEAESEKSHFADFQINISMLKNHLENQTVLSHNWLAQITADTRFEMDIRDNGSRLVFENLNPLSIHEDLFEAARQTAREQYMVLEEAVSPNSLLPIHAEFKLSQEGQNYFASVLIIPKNSGSLNVAVLCPLTDLYQTLRFRRILFLSADLAGILLLALFFWFFTWYMIQPLIINNQKQAEFIASASHELRSPLAVIISSLSAMTHASVKDRERFSETIRLEGKRMSRLIDDMLTLSGTGSSLFSVHKTPVEMDTLLLSVYEKFEPLALKKSISLTIALPDELVAPCLCDRERMEQVLSILLDNALSYTPSQGKIALSLQTVSDKLIFRVADNGPGIPDSEKEAVFDRFYRCDKSHKDKAHFGLGLCIAREIIHMHKGSIRVEDTPGGGAAFVVTLRCRNESRHEL